MSETYLELYYHLVWGTKGREPYITPAVKVRLYAYLRSRCADLRVQVYALNGLADHVHLACSIPPTVCVANLVKTLKGASANAINRASRAEKQDSLHGDFIAWQPGYGALTFSFDRLGRITAYIDNQERAHQEQKLIMKLERVREPD